MNTSSSVSRQVRFHPVKAVRRHVLTPSNLAAVSLSIAIRSASLNPGVSRRYGHRCLGPRKRQIGTHHDLARPDLGRQMPEAFGGENHKDRNRAVSDTLDFFLSGTLHKSGRFSHIRSDRAEYEGKYPPACAPQILRPGNLSSVPSKMRCGQEQSLFPADEKRLRPPASGGAPPPARPRVAASPRSMARAGRGGW